MYSANTEQCQAHLVITPQQDYSNKYNKAYNTPDISFLRESFDICLTQTITTVTAKLTFLFSYTIYKHCWVFLQVKRIQRLITIFRIITIVYFEVQYLDRKCCGYLYLVPPN